MAFKILQNALYGTYAINSWRFTDGFKICSAAITNSGQRLTKESITFVNDYISKQLDTDPKTFVIASDTDSLYMELTDLLKHRNPDLKYEDDMGDNMLLEIQSTLKDYTDETLIEEKIKRILGVK